MFQTTRCSIEFNRDRDTGRNPCCEAKKQTEANAVADAKDDGIRYRPGKQPQRAVSPAQQVVGQIEATQHIKKGTSNADRGNRMMIDRHVMIVSEPATNRKKLRREIALPASISGGSNQNDVIR